MTREEIEKAIRVLKEWQSYFESLDLDSESPEDDPTSEADSLEAFKLAIKALKQEPCEDAISRKAVLDATVKKNSAWNAITNASGKNLEEIINSLPNVTPKLSECEDAISRADANKLVDELARAIDDQNRHYPKRGRDIAIIARDIERLPSVTPTPKWIPVSERLPEDRRIVLVTAYWHETYQVMMASYFGDGLWYCVPYNNCGEHMQTLKPKAWMPLPEPYKESKQHG